MIKMPIQNLKISKHRIVLVVARKERGIALKNVLERTNCHVFIGIGMYEGMQLITQEMPHLILTEAVLPDGDAALLFDRLAQKSHFKDTPILVNVLQKNREILQSLAKRKFSGFFLGVSEPSPIIKKVQDVLATHCVLSPYHQDTQLLELNENLSVSIEAKAIGRAGFFLVTTAPCKLDFCGQWRCTQVSNTANSITLTMCSNLDFEGQVFNLFPYGVITGKGRLWVESLPSLGSESSLFEKKQFVYYHPDEMQAKRMVESLAGYGIKGLATNRVADIQFIIDKNSGVIASIVIDSLHGDQEINRFEAQLGDIEESIKIIAINSNIDAQSDHCVWTIPAPIGMLPLLSRVFASLLDPHELSAIVNNTGLKSSPVYLTTRARVLGLDESGGFLNTQIQIYKDTRVTIGHKFFQELLGSEGLVEVTDAIMDDTGQGSWYVRFNSIAKGMSKGKYLEKIITRLQDHRGLQD